MLPLTDQRITVMGLGHFGGGLGVTRWLVEQGADVLVTDAAPEEKLAEALAELRPLIVSGKVTTRLGGHNVSDFTDTDLVIANPAVPTPWDNRFLRSASAAGVPTTTEIRLLAERLPNRANTIGVTGSAGKSTTTAMIAHALRRIAGEGNVVMGGNIGGSLLAELPRITPETWVVLELSSAMLHWLDAGAGYADAPGFSPRVAVCTNIAPNHIDWHASFEHYQRSKRVITAHQRAGDALVLASSDPAAPPGNWTVNPGVGIVHVKEPAWYAQRGLDAALKLPGQHNRTNAWTAAEGVAALLNPSGDEAERARLMHDALQALADFPGLAHRLCQVGTVRTPRGEAHAFNDSKSTTPESAAMALAALGEDERFGAARVHLIAGGYDKKVDLSPMIRPASRCAGVYTIGATGPAIAAGITAAGGRAFDCATLEAAVTAARAHMNPGDALLLSPGCASWDQFTHFEKRGEMFVDLATKSS
ncbi:MAG: UDP-N-acetylmuramoyl-L-alanine--D-glutamate ligase [Phycisphaerales bacterium]